MTDEQWRTLLIPYGQAVQELIIKFQNIVAEYNTLGKYSPIEQVTGRLKTVESIKDKMARQHIAENELTDRMNDIAGVRLICRFVEDIDYVVELVRSREDMEVMEETNYVGHKKESGYRSYHMVINYPIYTALGRKNILAEIQIRTMAMNFWATIEHSLSYKYAYKVPEDVTLRLQRASDAAFDMDKEMSSIRNEILSSPDKMLSNHT